MGEDEVRLPLHQREVAAPERRLPLRRQQQLSGPSDELVLRGPLVLGLLEGEDQRAERLQPAVPDGVGDKL
jgi:hypothetical protein